MINSTAPVIKLVSYDIHSLVELRIRNRIYTPVRDAIERRVARRIPDGIHWIVDSAIFTESQPDLASLHLALETPLWRGTNES